jgi:hypothetical protein
MANQGLFAAPLLSLVIAASIFAQTPQPVAQSWSGWAQCQITIQAPGYSHRETHLWTVTGAGTRNANVEIYPTSWTVTGNGSLQRVNGPTTVSAQWMVNGTLQNVTIGATLHVDRITVQRWTNHGPARSGLTGTEISTTNGVARSRYVVLDVQQWAFPGIETGTTSNRATGSSTLPFDGLRGPMNPPSGAMGTAACTWDFARGGVSPSSPPPSTVNAPATPSPGTPVSGGSPTGSGAGTPSAPGSPAAAGTMVSLVFPNGGEKVGAGDGAVTRLIRFRYGSATAQQRFDTDLSTDAGATWTSLRRNDQPSLVEGIFLLNLQLPRISTNRAMVRVTPTGRPEAAGVSAAPFTIVLGSIKVTVPAPLVTGQSATISWTHDLPADQRRFRVRLVRPNLPESEQIRWLGEVVATGSSESYTFTVPGPATTQAQLTVITPDDLFAAFSPPLNIDASSTPSSSTGGGAAGTSAGGSSPGGAGSPTTTDLAISFFGGSDPSGLTIPSSWPANGTARYGLGVVNLGSGPADGARITVPPSAGLTKTAVSCGGQQGAQSTNPTVAQIESGFAITTLPPGSFVTCQIVATVTDTAGSSVTMGVTVTPPGGVSDPNPGNDTATQTLPIVSAPGSATAPTGGPRIASVTPGTIELGSGCNNEITFTGDGTHWGFESTLDMGPGVQVRIRQPQSPTRFVAFVAPDYSTSPGARPVTVRTGDEVVTLPNAVTVVAREQPTVTVTPSSAPVDAGFITVTLTGRGTRWQQGVTQVFVDTVTPNNTVRLEEFAVNSPTSLTLRLYVYGSTAGGANEIRIYNRRASSLPGACEDITLPSGFTVTGATSQTQPPAGALPSITSVTPAAAPPGTRALAVSIAATGTHFVQGVSYIDFGELAGATSLTITSPTTATAIINVDPAAPPGPRNITMTTPSPDGTSEVVSRTAAFTIGSTQPTGGAPPSTNTSPASGTASASGGRYRVTATSVYFRNAEADNPGPAIGDGKGDEIYLTSYAQVYDRRSGNQLSAGPLVRTPVHGDMSGAGGAPRVRAGSATPNGGIATGDEVQLQMPGASPVWLWEGELRDGIDVVVLRPVLWEFDGNEAAWYTVYAQRFPPAAPRQVFDLPVVQAAIPRAGVAFESVPGFTMTGAWVADTQDHPIGSVLNIATASGAVAGTWTDRMLTLTREKLEPWLTAAGGAGRVELRVWGEIHAGAAGVGTIQQNVRQDAVADYTLNVTIERRP